MANRSAAAGAAASDGQLVEAPAASPASAEADDLGETSSTTPTEVATSSPEVANDNDPASWTEEPLSSEVAPDASPPLSAVEALPEAANDNAPPAELPATGTE